MWQVTLPSLEGGSQCTLLFRGRKPSDLDTDSELAPSTLFSESRRFSFSEKVPERGCLGDPWKDGFPDKKE